MQDETLRFPDIALLDRSKSFHSTAEGKMWTRLLINLSWWLHDMYEKDGCDPNEKFAYVENKLEQCKSLFPERFVLMFSNPEFSPNKQHPFLICRHDQHRTILLIFRATVSSKSIQDVFTDLRLYSNHDVYEGDRHAGFASRADSGPTLAVAHWLQQGWKVIISGHSLGGAVSQLFTARVIDSLVEIGLTVDRVVLRCITFGTPQCADHHFWSKYAAWYDIFDTYIYENDAIFRLVTFGTEAATSVAKAFANQIINYGKKVIQYIDNDQCRNLADSSFEQICINGVDILLPKYYVFGRHHFIMKDERANLMIKSIGELEEDRQRLMTDLKYGTKEWYKYFIEKEMMFSGSLKFVYRDFADHGCYPFAINQLFNEEANRRLVELKESREQATIIPQEQSDARAILFCRSDRAIEFLKEHSTFNIEITTFFNVTDIQVTVLSNEKNSALQRMEHLDPISTALLSYHDQLSGCKQLHRIKNVKTEQERDMYWKKMYIEEPLKDMPDKYRWNWIGMMQICLQLNSMHEILLTKPPKLVLSGKSQTGKSTLFHHLTGQNLEELRNIDAFNTRMSLQCSALITFDENNHTKSELTIDVVDNPGQDDATEQARNLLNITLHTASLFIVVSTLEDVNQKHNIELIDYLLQETSVNILVLINKIDVRLFEEWIQFKNKSMIDDTSDHDDWEKGEDYVRDVTVPVNSNFNASDTVEKLIRRPKQELITSLIHDKKEIDRRLTIKPIILKQFKKVDTYYQDLRNFSRSDKNFLSQVSKSNVNKWIIENLTSVYD
ncbi:unnamed protein product [Rotaria sp. Silwood2]|nr:unnamed protein product [Rotaria sp. Silwood2]